LLFQHTPDILPLGLKKVSLFKEAFAAKDLSQIRAVCSFQMRIIDMASETTTPKLNMPADKKNSVEKKPVAKKRILIIEDEYSASKFLTMRLKNLGYSVSAAFDGMTGLKEATETLPDLIILDLMIPKLPGEEVCKALRESYDENLVKIPIIMLTGKDSIVDKILGKVIGADAYLTKPYEFSDLFAAIKKILPDV
jgi:CheY-like chemotaxis protein